MSQLVAKDAIIIHYMSKLQDLTNDTFYHIQGYLYNNTILTPTNLYAPGG